MRLATRHAALLGIEIGILAGLHFLLIRWLADKQLVSMLLAPGGHLSRGLVALALVFVLVRFVVIFVLPGWILVRLTQIVFDLVKEVSGVKAQRTILQKR